MKTLISSLLIISGLFGLSASYAEECNQKICTVNLINHVKQLGDSGLPLLFTVYRGNAVLPELKESLNPGESQKINVKNLNNEEAYIRVTRGDGTITNAFFKVSPNKISGYIGKKIAYTWTEEKDAKIIFCTSTEYEAYGKC